MINGKLSKRWLFVGGILFAVVGAALYAACYPNTPFTEEVLIYDLIRLDIWSLSFVAILVTILLTRLEANEKAWWIVLSCSAWGLVTSAIFFHGAPFAFNGYGGDQAFRIAMILKFKTFAVPGDFYYKDLPPFYPPVLYWLLAMIAQIASVNAHTMMKFGTELIYLCSPVALFLIWRKLVTPIQASLVALFAVVFLSFGKAAPLVAPHAFLSNSFFIPWWLYYVERVGAPRTTRGFYLTGGVIGALLFMTYYFPFFIGGFLLFIRLLFDRPGKLLAAGRTAFSWRSALTVLALSAVFSSIFWGPLLWSFVTIGYNSAQQEWHHLNSPGIDFLFVQFSLGGLAYLAALLYAVRRHRIPIFRGFLLLTGTVLVFHLIGSILGVLDKPVNLIKASEFIALAGGSLIGLTAASYVRKARWQRPRTLLIPSLILAVFIAMLHQVNEYAKQPAIRNARSAGVPTFGLDKQEMIERTGSVFLAREDKLYTFYPVYAFFSINQHYSHPAAQYEQRLDLLDALQSVHDPYVFNLALRENRYDRIDYFMPALKDGQWELLAAFSNYPNKYRHVFYHYDTLLTADTALFVPEFGPHLFGVRTPANLPPARNTIPEDASVLRRIAGHLTEQGRQELARHTDLTIP
ncbi:arabinofuranosyltransferase [bacterium]|nr:arabinofuranosyltransferase [bacterium]